MDLNPVASTPPPPQARRVGLGERPVRLAGIVIACSTPISGLLSYAFASILFGEDRFEDSGGLTVAGVAVLAMPLVLGVLLVLWSFLTPRTPGRRTVATLTAVAGVILLGVGLWSTLSSNGDTPSGDASIGGGLLVLASLPLAVVALLLFRGPTSPACEPTLG